MSATSDPKPGRDRHEEAFEAMREALRRIIGLSRVAPFSMPQAIAQARAALALADKVSR